ncbi:MAG: hypothetical protein H0V73_09155 [Chloroflexi bacterium]|nr:hypothetical protein [Chloroflexota bacterium]
MSNANRTAYVATYTHDDRAWIVQFRDPDLATFGRTLASAKRHARSALAVHLEVDDLVSANVDVVDDVRIPSAVADEVGRVVEQRSKVDALRSELAQATRRTAADLRRLGFSTRDVAEILGISGARVAQMDREASSS